MRYICFSRNISAEMVLGTTLGSQTRYPQSKLNISGINMYERNCEYFVFVNLHLDATG